MEEVKIKAIKQSEEIKIMLQKQIEEGFLKMKEKYLKANSS
jgi:hypothetical protein